MKFYQDFGFQLLAGSMLGFFAIAGGAMIYETYYTQHIMPVHWVFAPIIEIDVFVEPPSGAPTAEIG